jgi:hypothetical protein
MDIYMSFLSQGNNPFGNRGKRGNIVRIPNAFGKRGRKKKNEVFHSF